MPEQRVESRSFSPAFKNICQIVAIGEIRDRRETLQRLILACASELGPEILSSGARTSEVLDDLYGLRVPPPIAQEAIDALAAKASIILGPDGHFVDHEVRAGIEARIAKATGLERDVREEWLSQVEADSPHLAKEFLWDALKAYLFRAFRRHGIQAAALLDPSIDNEPGFNESLSLLLQEAVIDHVPEKYCAEARTAISGFLATLENSRYRSAYITQLADGTFSYFSLTVSPEAAKALAGELQPLQLFLDTNFIFGVFHLGDHVFADLSDELVDLATTTNLPFSLHYHPRTDREVNSSISYWKEYLGSRQWGDGIARAAVKSRNLPGIVRQYLGEYLRTGVDVETFFRPLRHPDELLSARGIREFTDPGDRQEEQATLLNEYKAYLEGRGIRKRYRLIEHDATLLDAVRRLRAETSSTLDAGALLLTYDYNLYRFDWYQRRKTRTPPVVVLPNVFWQIIRPFVPPDEDFDRSFAETFALPEFRTLGSDSAAASSRMLAILASYEGLPERTAARLLSNDLLLDQLKAAPSDGAVHSAIKDAVIEDNRLLLEDLNRERQVAVEARRGEAASQKELEGERQRIARLEAQVKRVEEALGEKVPKDELSSARNEVERERLRADEEAAGRLEERRLREAQSRKLSRWLDVGAVTSGVLLGGLTFFLLGWSEWVVQHERTWAVRSLSLIVVTLSVIWILRPRLRRSMLLGSGGILATLALLAAAL